MEKVMPRVGDVEVTKKIRQWHGCNECGYPAKFRMTFLLEGFRHNPASSGYGRDDCSWCSDLDVYTCAAHKRELEQTPPGYSHGTTTFPLKKFKHMGFYWETVTNP